MLVFFIFLLCALVLIMAIVNSRVDEFFELVHVPSGNNNNGVIFTMTTYLSLPGKLDQFYAAMDSVIGSNVHVVVINEYTNNDNEDYAKRVKERYPSIEFVQKNEHQKGQARSLNMILDMIWGYEYWVHWEESWIASNASFLKKAINIMDHDKSITQLQFTPDWTDASLSRLDDHGDYIIVSLHAQYKDIPHDPKNFDALVSQYGLNVMWPLYSLRPSINRVKHYLGIGKFDEDPKLWPVRFEYEYSLRWVDAGCVKAVIAPPVAMRQANHVSTYA